MKWRKWNYVLHRDIGFLCIGLTLIYAVSGIAVNHTSHAFNPSYTITKSTATVSPLAPGSGPDMQYVHKVLEELGESGTYKNVAMIGPQSIRIFVEGNNIDVDLKTGAVLQEQVRRKPLLFEINFLHLNKYKKGWTWIADIYGVALILLAVTGLLMIRGRNTLRGLLLTGAGFLLPAVALFIML